MIGFLVHDERLFSATSVVGACRALRTFSYQNTEHVESLRIHFFRNASLNNYYLRDERHTLCATGTLILNDVHGDRALSNLSEALNSGKELVDLFDKIRGPYTLVHIDRAKRQVSILNSREGLRNCYLARGNKFRAYSTNLLLIAALTAAAPCAEGVRQFIHLGATMDEKTIFEKIERLSAASLHTYHNEEWTTSRLWRLQTATPERSVTRERATEVVIESFARGLEFTSNIDSGRVVADLTGGTDSRLVLCCLMQQHAKPVVSTSGQQDFVDVRIAQKVAKKLGIEHYRYEPVSARMTSAEIDRTVELADGGRDVITLAKVLPYYEERARRFRFITGGAGGPLFKDHYWLFEFNRVGLNREPNWGRIAKLSLVPYGVQDGFFTGFNDGMMDNATEMLQQRSGAIEGTNNQKLDFVYFDLKIPAFFGPEFSLTTQFMDVFHPMVDGGTVQYSINLPPEIRIRNILQFCIINRLRPELCWILTDKGLPTIPPVGVNSWLRVLRGRRYVETGFRKLRTALLGASGHRTDTSTDVEGLRSLGYFDLLSYSSLAISSFISAPKLAEFKDWPEKQPNQQYLIATLSVQLFFERAKELMNCARKTADQPASGSA